MSRRGPPWDHEPTFKQACDSVRIATDQCERCRGAGVTSMELLASPKMIYEMAKHEELRKEPIPIQRNECLDCQGRGYHIRPGQRL